CVDEVSDHAITLLLMAERRVLPAANATEAGDWAFSDTPAYHQIHRLRGRTWRLADRDAAHGQRHAAGRCHRDLRRSEPVVAWDHWARLAGPRPVRDD